LFVTKIIYSVHAGSKAMIDLKNSMSGKNLGHFGNKAKNILGL